MNTPRSWLTDFGPPLTQIGDDDPLAPQSMWSFAGDGAPTIAIDTGVSPPRLVLTFPGGGGGGGGIIVQEEGTPLATTCTTMNFVGPNCTASGTGATKTVTFDGNFGSASVTGGIITAATRMIAPSLDTTGTGTLSIGTRNTGSGDTGPVSISRTGQTTTCNGAFAVTQTSAFTGAVTCTSTLSATTLTASTAFNGPIFDSVSGAGATMCAFGGTNATSCEFGKAGASSTVKGSLTVDQTSTFTGVVTIGASSCVTNSNAGTRPSVGAIVALPYNASSQVFLAGRTSGGGNKSLFYSIGDTTYFGEYASAPALVYGNVCNLNGSISAALQGPTVGLWDNGSANGFTITPGSALKIEADTACASVAYTQASTASATGADTTISSQAGGTNPGKLLLKTGATNQITMEPAGMALGASAGSYGAGVKVVFIANATTEPTTNPSGGALMWAFGGAIKARGSSGTATTMAPASPHCDRCGRDFVHERENANYGDYVSVCIPCDLESREADQRAMLLIAAKLGMKPEDLGLIPVDQFAVRKLAA